MGNEVEELYQQMTGEGVNRLLRDSSPLKGHEFFVVAARLRYHVVSPHLSSDEQKLNDCLVARSYLGGKELAVTHLEDQMKELGEMRLGDIAANNLIRMMQCMNAHSSEMVRRTVELSHHVDALCQAYGDASSFLKMYVETRDKTYELRSGIGLTHLFSPIQIAFSHMMFLTVHQLDPEKPLPENPNYWVGKMFAGYKPVFASGFISERVVDELYREFATEMEPRIIAATQESQ